MFHIVQTMKLLQGLRLTVHLNKKNTHMFVCVCDKICAKLIYERERERQSTNIQRVNSCKSHQLTVEQKTIDQNILHKILHATLAREGFHAQKDNLLM